MRLTQWGTPVKARGHLLNGKRKHLEPAGWGLPFEFWDEADGDWVTASGLKRLLKAIALTRWHPDRCALADGLTGRTFHVEHLARPTGRKAANPVRLPEARLEVGWSNRLEACDLAARNSGGNPMTHGLNMVAYRSC